MKTCSRCGKEKTSEHFSPSKISKGGLAYECKQCKAERERNRRQKKKIENQTFSVDKRKTCSGCKHEKPATEFGSDVNNKGGLFKYCKSCSQERRKDYKNRNLDEVRQRARDDYWKNRGRKLAYMKEYRNLNRQTIRKKESQKRKDYPEYFSKIDKKRYYENREANKKARRTRYNSPIKWSSKSGLALQIGYYEDIRKSGDGFIAVFCAYCGELYVPTERELGSRLQAINGVTEGEGRIYCSQPCKDSCPSRFQKKYPKGYKPATSREVQPELRQLVFQRDNYTCQKCDTHKDNLDSGIHCHHILPLNESPVESADEDNCITLCEDCHKEVHKLPGCIYSELRC